MKKLFLFSALALTFSFTACNDDGGRNNKDATESGQEQNAEYQCPMKCEGDKTYSVPGECPVCNMELEKI